MKIFSKSKIICCVLSLFILVFSFGGCSNSKEDVPMGDFALKYKDSEMSLQEYIAVVMEISCVRDLRGDIDKIKTKSIESAKLTLLVCEKLKQAGKDLPEERKKSARDSVYKKMYEDFENFESKLYNREKSLDQSEKEEILKAVKETLEAAGTSIEAYEEFAENSERRLFGVVNEHIEVREAEYNDVIVNDEIINKADIANISKIANGEYEPNPEEGEAAFKKSMEEYENYLKEREDEVVTYYAD